MIGLAWLTTLNIDQINIKLSNGMELLAKLTHFVPGNTLENLCSAGLDLRGGIRGVHPPYFGRKTIQLA